ncbi:unnamed protein product [Adineta steineri]|uniref:Uncharacterized protein n=1 Tax=Adineta steineri TaxID=433720 RepID=A0A819CDV3_9BILA|nr:unnamed protein product [Adineta steineri]
MDLTSILLGFLVFSVIVLFLGALNYFLGRPQASLIVSDKKSSSDSINQQQQQQTNRTNACANRRKQARNAKRNQRQQTANVTNENLNSNTNNKDNQETKSVTSERKIEQEDDEEDSQTESPTQQTDDEQEQTDEFYDVIKNDEEVLISSPSNSIQDEQEPCLPVRQRKKHKNNSMNSKSLSPSSTIQSNSSSIPLNPPKNESTFPSKPQASVVPVKQTHTQVTTSNIESHPIQQDNNSKSNGHGSSSYNIYSYSGHSSIPPRFRQQNVTNNKEKFRKKKSSTPIKKSSIQLDSAARQNDFVPSLPKQQTNNNNQSESPRQQQQQQQQQQQHESSNQNGYSSESDNLSEAPSTVHTNNQNHSSVLSTSTDSQHSLKGLELLRSVPTSNILLEELVSLFDTVSFSSEELELILNKITTKQLLNRQDWQRLLSATSTKNDKSIERILDETYRSQAKILAIELQTEKNRVFELTKTNAEMDNTIRQLQQPNNNMIPYQQTILSYQMQLRRVTDENAHLAHQLHAYSMMPGSINELKQQQQILDEQLRQLTMRNSTLEKEVADGDRASKHAAEIYKKADAQKQERIEQMIADINKYKKINKDLSILQQKHKDLEKNSNLKLNELIKQRNELQKSYDYLKEKVQQYDQLKAKYDELVQSQAQMKNVEELEQELIEVKAKNDLLRQRNWKVMEQLNKHSHKQEQNQSD